MQSPKEKEARANLELTYLMCCLLSSLEKNVFQIFFFLRLCKYEKAFSSQHLFIFRCCK